MVVVAKEFVPACESVVAPEPFRLRNALNVPLDTVNDLPEPVMVSVVFNPPNVSSAVVCDMLKLPDTVIVTADEAAHVCL